MCENAFPTYPTCHACPGQTYKVKCLSSLLLVHLHMFKVSFLSNRCLVACVCACVFYCVLNVKQLYLLRIKYLGGATSSAQRPCARNEQIKQFPTVEMSFPPCNLKSQGGISYSTMAWLHVDDYMDTRPKQVLGSGMCKSALLVEFLGCSVSKHVAVVFSLN